LVHAGTGALLLGWVADEAGNINTSSDLQPIKVPVGGALAARLQPWFDSVATWTRGLTLVAPKPSVSPSTTAKATLTLSASPSPKPRRTLGTGRQSSMALSVGSGTVQFSDQGQWPIEASGQLHSHSRNGAASPQTIQLDFSSSQPTGVNDHSKRCLSRRLPCGRLWRRSRLTLAVSSSAVSQTV
jgi:hypothetical protein